MKKLKKKHFGENKNLLKQNLRVKQNFWSKKLLVKQIFFGGVWGPKILKQDRPNCWSKRICQKKIKRSCIKKFLVNKNLWSKKNFGQKIVGQNLFQMLPGTYILSFTKIGSVTAEILLTLSLCEVGVQVGQVRIGQFGSVSQVRIVSQLVSLGQQAI